MNPQQASLALILLYITAGTGVADLIFNIVNAIH